MESYLTIAASLDEKIEGLPLVRLLLILFGMILVMALIKVRLFYAGLLLIFVAMLLHKHLRTRHSPTKPAPTKPDVNLRIDLKSNDKQTRRIDFAGSLPTFIIFIGGAVMIIDLVQVSPTAFTDAYKVAREKVPDLTDDFQAERNKEMLKNVPNLPGPEAFDMDRLLPPKLPSFLAPSPTPKWMLEREAEAK